MLVYEQDIWQKITEIQTNKQTALKSKYDDLESMQSTKRATSES